MLSDEDVHQESPLSARGAALAAFLAGVRAVFGVHIIAATKKSPLRNSAGFSPDFPTLSRPYAGRAPGVRRLHRAFGPVKPWGRCALRHISFPVLFFAINKILLKSN